MTDRLYDVFGHRLVITPVVHVTSTTQGVREAGIAHACGADGVFLICHDGTYHELVEVIGAVRETVGGFIGANALDLTAGQAFEHVASHVDALWCDDAGIDERERAQPRAEQIVRARAQLTSWNGLYLGGVAFKYQRHVHDLEKAGRIASRYMDVVTTSGEATGVGADVEKVARLAQASQPVPLAIASGVDTASISGLVEAGARMFLVASSVTKSFDEFDVDKLRELVERVRALEPQAP